MSSLPGDGIADGVTPDQGDDAQELRARLQGIEDLPLDQRADEYAQVHAQLQSLLEGSDIGDDRG
ncbi:MAG: hypothetical protein ABWY54_01120 [Glaciihabitans sp.]